MKESVCRLSPTVPSLVGQAASEMHPWVPMRPRIWKAHYFSIVRHQTWKNKCHPFLPFLLAYFLVPSSTPSSSLLTVIAFILGLWVVLTCWGSHVSYTHPFPRYSCSPWTLNLKSFPLLRLPSSSSCTPSSTTRSFVSYFTISTMNNSHTSVFTGARPCLLMPRHLHSRFEPAWLTWCCCCLWVFPSAFQTWIWVDLTV